MPDNRPPEPKPDPNAAIIEAALGRLVFHQVEGLEVAVLTRAQVNALIDAAKLAARS